MPLVITDLVQMCQQTIMIVMQLQTYIDIERYLRSKSERILVITVTWATSPSSIIINGILY